MKYPHVPAAGLVVAETGPTHALVPDEPQSDCTYMSYEVLGVNPEKEYVVAVTATIVPDPWANPAAPYSIFQAVSVPPAVQDKSAETSVTFETERAVGLAQDGVSLTSMSSTKMSLW